MSQLSEAAIAALRAGLAFAQGNLLSGDDPIDAENWFPEDLPTDEKARLLLLLRSDVGFSDDELRVHLGAPPIPADRQTHVLVSGMLHGSFPACYVVGEEATEEEWDAAETAGAGAIIFALDAIDGSEPYDTLTFGFSCNLLAYRREFDHDELLFAAVANSSGVVITYEDPASVSVGTMEDLRPISQPLSDDFRPSTVAVLGATPGHRRLVQFLLDDDSLTVFTTGGAPASLGLVIGRLEALVCPRAQTTHDTAYLPMLALLGIPIIIRGGLALSFSDVRSYFSAVARRQEDRTAKPVPPFVAARNPHIAGELARFLAQS